MIYTYIGTAEAAFASVCQATLPGEFVVGVFPILKAYVRLPGFLAPGSKKGESLEGAHQCCP